MRRWRIEFGRWRRHNDQDHANGDGMADGERDHIRPDAGFVDAKRRFGVRTRDLLMGDADNITGYGDDERGSDLHSYGCG
jgi:hypothetical protein